MTIQLWCLLAAVALPYVWAGASVPFRSRQFGGPDLNYPRVQGEQLTERGAGAWGAQANAWENLIAFATANLAAYMAGVDPGGSWATASLIWVLARVLHGVFYIANMAAMRVLAFVLGLAMNLWIFTMAFAAV